MIHNKCNWVSAVVLRPPSTAYSVSFSAQRFASTLNRLVWIWWDGICATYMDELDRRAGEGGLSSNVVVAGVRLFISR